MEKINVSSLFVNKVINSFYFVCVRKLPIVINLAYPLWLAAFKAKV